MPLILLEPIFLIPIFGSTIVGFLSAVSYVPSVKFILKALVTALMSVIQFIVKQLWRRFG
jgi:fructose-specific phosphotransferase system IIC component